MAGVKRKLDAAKGTASSPSSGNAGNAGISNNSLNSTAGDTPNGRVTRSHRASQDARVHQVDTHKSHTNTSTPNNKNNGHRLSRIITLSTRGAPAGHPAYNPANSATSSPATNARETRASRTRAAAPPAAPATLSQSDSTKFTVPETPRSKRVKRGPAVEETPRSTRQSARLRSNPLAPSNENGSYEAHVAPKQTEASPSLGATPSGRTRTRSRQMGNGFSETIQNGAVSSAAGTAKSSSPQALAPDNVENHDLTDEEQVGPKSEKLPAVDKTPKSPPSHEEAKNGINDSTQLEAGDAPHAPKDSSSITSEKHESPEIEDNEDPEPASAPVSPNKKPKSEDGELNDSMEEPGDIDVAADSQSPAEEAADSKAGSRQLTEELDEPTPENSTEPATVKTGRGGRTRGRGRGGRSRGARLAASRRGRGGPRTARGGRGRHLDRSSDAGLGRSPSPSAATQKLKDRQRELDRTFRRVAAAQRLALAVLASQSQKKISRDKNAHKEVPEFEEVNVLLKKNLMKKQEVLRRDYELKVAQENRLFDAYKEILEERLKASAVHIKEEHFLASHGEYMALVESRRAAEDDEHTETEDTPEPRPVIPPAKELARGFNSSFVRNPAGAAAYDRAEYGWDDFVQRAKLGDDIDPQIKEIGDANPLANLSDRDAVDLLLQATGVAEPRPSNGAEKINSAPVSEAPPTALFALADLAAAEMPRSSITHSTPRLSAHRTLLPQVSPTQMAAHGPHGPADPRAVYLPPMTPRQPPRRLLPASQQIPPLHEHLGMPDRFTSEGGVLRLPPPPGSNLRPPPLPGYLASHHHHRASIYYPPPHAGPPRPPY